MDIEAPSKEVSQELVRELLIAISNTTPDKVQNLDNLVENSDTGNGIAVVNDDVAEKYRSELISISYAESPDGKISPVTGQP